MPSTINASAAFCAGIIIAAKPSALACIAMASIPLMGYKLPSSPSSPMNKYFSIREGCVICSEAANMPMAMGKSKAAPDFFKSAGDKLITSFVRGI